MQCGILHGILEKKKNIGGKTREIQIESEVSLKKHKNKVG